MPAPSGCVRFYVIDQLMFSQLYLKKSAGKSVYLVTYLVSSGNVKA